MKKTIPTLKISRTRKPQVAKRVGRTVRSPKLGMTLAEFLALASPDEQATNLEQILDGAAQQLGRGWDGRQVTIQLLQGASTSIDRVLLQPRTAVYADGPVHEFRPELASRDRMQRVELEGMGWRVIRLNWRELLSDPVRTVARVFYG